MLLACSATIYFFFFRIFVVKVCNKSFASSPNLLRHSLTHMGTKPYPCPVCGKRFAQAGTLKRHALTHSQAQDAKRRRRARVTVSGPMPQLQLGAKPHFIP